MYVLVVTFYRTVQPCIAYATHDAQSWTSTLKDVVMAVSESEEKLDDEAESIKDRYSSTFHSYRITYAKEI